MKTAYVVTSGEYSDYSIRGVFDNRELAEKFVALLTDEDSPTIEEWPVNPSARQLRAGYSIFFVRMDREGKAMEARQEGSAYGINGRPGFDINGCMFVTVMAKDAKHAVKITNEKRAGLIARNEWTPDV